jgi:hypothetical protein
MYFGCIYHFGTTAELVRRDRIPAKIAVSDEACFESWPCDLEYSASARAMGRTIKKTPPGSCVVTSTVWPDAPITVIIIGTS